MNDDRRAFATWQRALIWIGSGGKCESCGEDISFRTFHADHVIPHSKGGQTKLSNAQALCAHCNSRKSNHMDFTQFFPAIGKPRQWQLEFLEKFHGQLQELASDPDRGFLLDATPGAGKTVAYLAAANMLQKLGLIDWVVVVVPAEPLLGQVAREAKALYGLELRHSATASGPDRLYRGEVITIHSVKNRSDASIISRNGRVFVVVDEMHHKGAGNTWGQSLVAALGKAKYKLQCTGTPFRSDGDAMPWCKYKTLPSGELKLLPDYSYNYGKALADSMKLPSEERIVRVAQFRLYDASPSAPIEVAINGEIFRHLLSDNLRVEYQDDRGKEFWERLRRLRFNAAIRPDFDLARRMIDDANGCLHGLRRTHHHAAGLIVCATKHQADRAAEVLRQLGEDPVVVYGDAEGDASSRKIKEFRKHTSPHRWIIAVQQVSEGVDIKRLRVCVWLTNKKTRLLFIQILGRIIRWEHLEAGGQVLTPKHQTAHMFMPREGSDSLDRDCPTDLVRYAKEIEQDVELVIGPLVTCNICNAISPSFGCEGCITSQDCPYFPDGEPPPPPPPGDDYEFLGAGAEACDHILRGEFWDRMTMEELHAMAESLGIEVTQLITFLRGMSQEDFTRAQEVARNGNAASKEATKTAEAVGVAVDDYDQMTLDEKMETLKVKVNKKVSRLGVLIARSEGWSDEDTRRQTIFSDIHKRWIRRSGKRNSDMTIGELGFKLEWLDQEIASLTKSKADAVV